MGNGLTNSLLGIIIVLLILLGVLLYLKSDEGRFVKFGETEILDTKTGCIYGSGGTTDPGGVYEFNWVTGIARKTKIKLENK